MSTPGPQHSTRGPESRHAPRRLLLTTRMAIAVGLAALIPYVVQIAYGSQADTAAAKGPAPSMPTAAVAPQATPSPPTPSGTGTTALVAPTTTGPTPTGAPTGPITTTSAASQQPPGDKQLPPPAADGKQSPKPASTDCTLQVPRDPLTAKGLATPYVLSRSGGGGACHEANADQAAFVEATIVNGQTGAVSVYHPVVVDRGTQPAVQPVTPSLDAGSVVGIWFGFNGSTLTLTGTGNSLNQGKCVNGLGGSKFGQFGYCNAPAFFATANAAVDANRLAVPPLGTGRDNLPCPTVRDFGVVDQDQSDNVATTYLVSADGHIAQDTSAAAQRLPGATRLANGSDNRLLDAFIDPALGCASFMAPDLTNNGARSPALALNELHAAARQAPPVALVPLSNPMTLVNGQQSAAKTDLYRAGVDQPQTGMGGDAGDPQTYCRNLDTIAPQRLDADRDLFANAPSPSTGAPNLLVFLQQRLDGSRQQLGCTP